MPKLIDNTELLSVIENLNKSCKEIFGGSMDPIEIDLHRHLSKEEKALKIREHAEYSALRRFNLFGPDPSEFIEAIGNASSAQFCKMKECIKKKDDTALGELFRKLTENYAIEVDIYLES